MRSSLFSSASNFFHLSWASIWSSDSFMVGVAQGWVMEGFCGGIGETLDSLGGSSVNAHVLPTKIDFIVPDSPTESWFF